MPEDMDIYMKKIKQRAEETDNVMGKIKADKMAELDKLRIDNEMEEVRARLEENRAKIRESQQTGQALAPKQAYNVAELLFAGRPPEEIKQIMDSLDEAALDKLAYLTGAMNGQQLGVFTQTLRRPETNVKDTIELINTVVKMNQRPTEQGITLQGIAALMKEMREAQTPQPQQPQQNSFEMMKQYHDMFLKPVLDQLSSKDKQMMEMRMSQIENKITAQVSPQDYIKTIKQTSQELGLSSQGKSEIDLKLEEMRETHDVQMATLGFETRKWEHQKDNEGKTIEQVEHLIKTVGESPIGRVLENLGSAGVDKIRGSGKKNSPNIVPVTCPNCQGKFQANDQLAKINCPLCGAELAKATVPAPQPPPVAEATEPEQKPQETQPTQPTIPEGQAQVDGKPAT